LDYHGNRNKAIELALPFLGNLSPASEAMIAPAVRTELATTVMPDMLRRDLAHQGLLSESVTVDSRLLAWVELV
jgi:hypothetical protein